MSEYLKESDKRVSDNSQKLQNKNKEFEEFQKGMDFQS